VRGAPLGAQPSARSILHDAIPHFHRFDPRYDYMALIGIAMLEGLSGHHLEVARLMTGRVRIGKREIAIDALGYRDRSKGGRY
jgi:hypothetical protein